MGGSSKGKKGSVGGTTANCAQEGDLAVIANQVGDTPTPFKDGLDVNVTPAGGAGKTDQKGLKVYTKLVTNQYKVAASLGGAAADKFELISKPTLTVNVPAGGIGVANFDVAAFAKIKIKLVQRRKGKDGKDNDTVLAGAKIEMSGREAKQGTTPKDPDWLTFEKVRSGDYTIKVSSLGSHAQKVQQPAATKVTLKPGAIQEVIIVTKAIALLRVVLWDKADKPIGGVAWKLAAPIVAQGTVPASGMIEIPNLALEPSVGTLQVTFTPPKPAPPPPPSPAPAPAPADGIPPYPPEVEPKDFKEPDPKPVTLDNDPYQVEWAVKLDEIETFNDEPGVQIRLCNLGFPCRPDAKPDRVTRSVKAYQKRYLKQDAGSGKLADVKPDVLKRHDHA